MKIAFAGDWHGNTHWAKEAIKHARAEWAETIVHVGDYGYSFTREYRDAVQGALRRTDLTLQFVDGNHEDFTWLYGQPIGEDGRREISPRVHHLPRGYRWEWEGVSFLALGGAFSVDRKWRVLGKSWWLEEQITDAEVEQAIEGGPVDVLVAHDCPSGILIPGLERGAHFFPYDALQQAAAHREQLRKVVEAVQPATIIHGHYHIPYLRSVDLGYGPVTVYGLDCDATSLASNVVVLDTEELPARSRLDSTRG